MVEKYKDEDPWALENSSPQDDLGEAKKDEIRKWVEVEGLWCSLPSERLVPNSGLSLSGSFHNTPFLR